MVKPISSISHASHPEEFLNEADHIIDRRRMRRKLGFWRIATLIAAIAFVGALWASFSDASRGEADHIARIGIYGIIRDDPDLVDLIDDAAEDERVKAIIVSLSTPGGTTYGGEQLHRAVLRAKEKKPVVADVRTLAASAGYMIAASTDHIVAGDSSIVGSIGVIFQYAQARQLLDTIGVRMEEIKSAPLKAEPSPFHDTSEEAKAMIRATVLDSFDWFVDLVAAGRKMDRDAVLALADGSVFTGRQALQNKLIDAIGGERQLRDYLKSRDVSADLEIIDHELPERRGLFSLASLADIALGADGEKSTLSRLFRELGGITSDKLFLDGLVSVWQFGDEGTPSK